MDESLYDELWRMEKNHWWFVGRRNTVRSLALSYLPDLEHRRMRVCELGCGCAANLADWAESHDVWGMEPSRQAREYAHRRLNQHIVAGSLPSHIPFRPGSFDLILLTDVLEHVSEDGEAAAAAIDLLAPGGILIATVPAYQWLYSPRDVRHHHHRRYSKRAFQQLFEVNEAHLELLSHYNTVLFPLGAASRLCSRLYSPNEGNADLRMPPRVFNRALSGLLSLEGRAIRSLSLPFGMSLVAVVRRTGDRVVRRAA